MSRIGHSNLANLKLWANTVQAESEFPRLIRRLIFETTPGLIEVGVPAGDSVRSGGWDGTCRSTTATPWVPEGLSVWELSVNKSPGTKANDDYAKRTSVPDGSPTEDATYMAAILRPWTARATWSSNKTKDGTWKSVRALGLDDVDEWLEAAPATHAWFSELLGHSPTGLRTAEHWWNSWSTQTSPVLEPSLVLSGRTNAVDKLESIIAGDGRITSIGHPNVDEVRAFLASFAHRNDDPQTERTRARTAFVDDISAWRRLLTERQPLVLIPSDPDMAAEVQADSPHHVLVPSVAKSGLDIELGPLDPHEAAAILEACGLAKDESVELGRLGRRSLTALRRRLANQPALNMPAWAGPHSNRLARSALLLHSWSDQNDGDRETMQSMAGSDYENARDALSTLSDPSDPLVQLFASGWSLVAPEDAWLLMGSSLTHDDIRNLERAAVEVLGEDDPSLDYADDEAWRAAWEGKQRKYSASLREGLARSLALLATRGSAISAPLGSTGEQWAGHIVHQLLQPAVRDSTGRVWRAVAAELPLLAEAAPDVFLRSMEEALQGSEPGLAAMFRDSGDSTLGFGPSSPHTYVLWALERLAWSETYFRPAVDLLATLAEVDPGGRLSNRPKQSLEDIFCPWHPETLVSVDGRLKALDGLARRHPELAWHLMVSMLPSRGGFHTANASPDYQPWKQSEVVVTNVEYLEVVDGVIPKLLADVGSDAARWATVLDRYDSLPIESRVAVRGSLGQIAESDDTQRFAIWNEVRDLIDKHREHSETDWALPAAEVDELEDAIASLTPPNLALGHSRLFTSFRPYLGDVNRREDFDAYDAALRDARTEAARSVIADGGVEAIRALAKTPNVQNGSVGMAAARASGDELLSELIEDLALGDGDQSLALDFLFQRFLTDGLGWLTGVLDVYSDGLTPETQGSLLAMTRLFPEAAEEADSRGQGVSEAFWRRFPVFGLGGDFAHVTRVVPRLQGVGRHAGAIELICLYVRRGSEDRQTLAELATKSLEEILSSEDGPDLGGLRQFDFETIFALLHSEIASVGADRIAGLEWAFLPALGIDAKPKTLHEKMAADPAFFVEVISVAFRPRNSDVEPTDQDDGRAGRAYRLLSNWKHCPGLDGDRIVEEDLRSWVDACLSQLASVDRYEVGAQHIGQVLATAPPDTDGDTPPRVVRDLLEDLRDTHVESGIRMRIVNSRGVVSRGLEQGGDQERKLAETFSQRADRFQAEWPRTATILRGIAESYQAEGRRNDEQAEKFRRGDHR